MNFPRYLDVTVRDEPFPVLVEIATDRLIELWDPHGWRWEERDRGEHRS